MNFFFVLSHMIYTFYPPTHYFSFFHTIIFSIKQNSLSAYFDMIVQRQKES